MTKRKPPDMTFPGWVEQQIRVAEAQGAFANLPGRGKPIPDLDRQANELDWLAGYLRRENVDVTEVLPPALALAKEVEELPGRLATIASESRVRRLIEDVNIRIDREYAKPQVGPPLRVKKVKVDELLAQWRAARAALAPRAAAAAAARCGTGFSAGAGSGRSDVSLESAAGERRQDVDLGAVGQPGGVAGLLAVDEERGHRGDPLQSGPLLQSRPQLADRRRAQRLPLDAGGPLRAGPVADGHGRRHPSSLPDVTAPGMRSRPSPWPTTTRAARARGPARPQPRR